MDYCRSLDLPVIEHSEDVSLAAGAVVREGVTSTRLGLRGMPAAAGSVCGARDVQLAGGTRARLHVGHLSARASLGEGRGAKLRGLKVRCRVARDHLRLVSLIRMVELFTAGPAGVWGMERKIAAGEPADLTIFSMNYAWTYHVKESPSKSRNSPFDGRAFKGAAAATIVGGRVVYKQ